MAFAWFLDLGLYPGKREGGVKEIDRWSGVAGPMKCQIPIVNWGGGLQIRKNRIRKHLYLIYVNAST